jgi:predicted helicase
VWLTNALEPAEREVRDLFFQPLAEEARGASEVKRQTPIMCVIGNPPYSGISQNNGEWITELIEDYKYIDGEHFGERKHWLQDDYVKFVRMAEQTIAQNPSGGVLGLITNHGYLDNPTFRGLRSHLLKTCDKIWVLDLHGNAKKKEVSPDGSLDQNVFDIQQGVAILIAVRKGKVELKSTQLERSDLWGSRTAKSATLWSRKIASSDWSRLKPSLPFLTFSHVDGGAMREFYDSPALDQVFGLNVTGLLTARDALTVDFSAGELRDKLSRFVDIKKSDAEVRREFFGSGADGKYPPGDSRGWKLPDSRAKLQSGRWENDIALFDYRPFDRRAIIYRPDMIDWGREKVLPNFQRGPNLGLSIGRQGHVVGGSAWNLAFCHSGMTDFNLFYRGGVLSFPLYAYPFDTPSQSDALAPKHRTLNLDPKLYTALCAAAGIDPADQAAPEADFRAPTGDARPSEVKVFDYVYGVLHAPAYRETFAEFLKIDFPRIPYPPSPEVFRDVSAKGEQLRRLHLMEPAAIGDTPYPYEGDGDDVVASGYPKLEGGRVMINKTQGFADAPPVAWSFPIGGYLPAQKWLKDRRGRALSWDDIGHYQRILKILAETDRIMRTIDLPLDTAA